jgi:serine phosphatase RsbU (regulator of sigma subunit)
VSDDAPSQSRSDTLSAPACMEVGTAPGAVRHARHFVEEQVIERGAQAVVDDAGLAAAELLANALQHGLPPVSVCVSGSGGLLRVEVRDGSTRAPVRPSKSLSDMTGRGLALVAAVAARWGVERTEATGKTVWAEFDATRPAAADHDADVDAILAAWTDDEDESHPGRYTVVLGDVPTDLLLGAKAHIDNVVREFSLARAAGASGRTAVSEHFASLIETVVDGFSDARNAIKRQALAAARRGESRTRLTLHLPATAADAGEAYLAALDEADDYSRAARLLTLETPPDHRLFRHWYVGAVVEQLRELAAGRTPGPVQPFEEVLVGEIRRLALSQRVTERMARLQRVTAALARARTPEDVATVVLSEGVDVLGASGGGLLVPAADGEHLAVPGALGYGVELVGALRDERIDAPLPAATALRTGEPVWLESQAERDREFPALRGFEAATVSMCAVPLLVGHRALGALRFSFAVRKLFDDDERAFVLALAAMTAQTLQRTELYEAERQAALDLQRALLPSEAPAVPGFDVATYYSPAGAQEAGGDFYDVIPLTDGRLVALVGDVMGRGVSAAAAMAQTRSTIRAYAIDNPDPRMVFERVDAYFEAADLAQLVTVLYLLVDPVTNVVEIANAGHLAPVLVDDTGSSLVPTAVGTPFGVGGFDREVTAMDLPRGASLVAITDGLVERRGDDIDDGINRLLQATTDAAGWSADKLLTHAVSSAAAQRLHDDDVTGLVLRRD